jgi:flagellin-like protein
MNRRAISPLIATVFLIAFAVALGAVIMSLGKTYVESIPASAAGAKVCDSTTVTDSLKLLQIQYINGDITKEQYADKQKAFLQ